jgi:DNA mismatch repair protein MLH1
MIENSLDAGSTIITITCKQGGMSLIQIQDNGHGIRHDDLEIVCERFTTSKISDFEDLKNISTFGFRGEALASITHVAHVTIISKTENSPCAFKAKYNDGKLVPTKSGDFPKPQPCAGNTGTIITVEDLFYNMPSRRQAFKNHTEEYQRVLDVCNKYAIHYAEKVSFTCKKNASFLDLHTPPSGSIIDSIRIIYGSAVAKDLLQLKPSEIIENQFKASINGYISNANLFNKKPVNIFFINNRLISSIAIKRAIDTIYSEILPKGTYPFIYLSITLPSENIDVNIHPTKKEVHFLDEEKLLEFISSSIKSLLGFANSSRTFYVQSVLNFSSGVSGEYLIFF